MKRILLLNSSYEAIGFIGDRRAISLFLRGVVDVITVRQDDILIQNSSLNEKPVPYPSILRLTQQHVRRNNMPLFRKKVVFIRDGYKCQYCFKSLSQRDATIDHVIPRSQGGKFVWKNVVTSCKKCNSYKDNKTPEQAGMNLYYKPTNPTFAQFWNISLNDHDWHESWTTFISM